VSNQDNSIVAVHPDAQALAQFKWFGGSAGSHAQHVALKWGNPPASERRSRRSEDAKMKLLHFDIFHRVPKRAAVRA